MHVGLLVPQAAVGAGLRSIGAFARAAEDLGFHHLTASDYELGEQPPNDDDPRIDRPLTDPLMLFSHLAGVTRRIRFVAVILALARRQIALLARQTADVDILSRGRIDLAIRASEPGADPRRDEQLELLARLWSDPMVTYRGAFHTLERVLLNPRPAQRLPIWKIDEGQAIKACRRDDTLIIGSTGQPWASRGSPEGLQGPQVCRRGLLVRSRGPGLRDEALRWRDAGGTHLTICSPDAAGGSANALDDFVAETRLHLDGQGWFGAPAVENRVALN